MKNIISTIRVIIPATVAKSAVKIAPASMPVTAAKNARIEYIFIQIMLHGHPHCPKESTISINIYDDKLRRTKNAT